MEQQMTDYFKDLREIHPLANVSDAELVRELLIRLGQGYPDKVLREGLQDTPARFMKFMREFLNPPNFKMTTFANEGYDEMVLVRQIPFYSLCEHHLAVIDGFASVAYIPRDKIVGLSKLPRTVDMFAHRLQNQERITKQVADYLQEHLEPLGVAVQLTARHYCMEMRGVKKHDTWTTTTYLTGVFKEDASCKSEFLKGIAV